MNDRMRWLIIVVFGVALAVRLVALAFWLPRLNPEVSLDSYRELGRNLAAGRGFVAALNGRDLPQVDRTPVYPLFLAGLMKTAGDRLGLFLAAQSALGAVTCALTVLLAARWLKWGAAGAAGLLVAIDPNSVIRCMDLRTETLFTLLLVAGCCVLTWRAEKSWAWIACGVSWSLAALTRPMAVWLWVVAAAVAVSHRFRFPQYTVFLAAYLALLGIWAGRNHALTGHCFVSTTATYNALMYRAAGVEAAGRGVSLDAVQQEFLTRYGDVRFFDGRERFEQTLQAYRRAAFENLSSAALVSTKQTIVGWSKLLLGPGAHALDNSLRHPRAATRWWMPMYTIALAGAILLGAVGAKRLGRESVLPAALVLYFVALAGGPESNSRFRVPITPMLAILAVNAFYEKRHLHHGN